MGKKVFLMAHQISDDLGYPTKVPTGVFSQAQLAYLAVGSRAGVIDPDTPATEAKNQPLKGFFLKMKRGPKEATYDRFCAMLREFGRVAVFSDDDPEDEPSAFSVWAMQMNHVALEETEEA